MRRITLALTVLACAATLNAATVTFSSELTTGQEIPAPMLTPESDPMGFGTSMFDWDAGTISTVLSWSNLTTPATMAHIHRRAPDALTGPPVVTIFMGMSLPETDTYDTGVQTLSTSQVTSVREGLYDGTLYYNIHTVMNPPGEIRGDIAPIPEPSSVLLMVSGGALLLLRRRLAR